MIEENIILKKAICWLGERIKEFAADNSDFVQGEKLAFRIITEMLQNDLKSGGLSLKDFEMDIDTKVL